MQRIFLAGLLLAGSEAAAAGWHTYSAANLPGAAGGWQLVAFWCDTPERVLALSATARPQGPSTLVQWQGRRVTVQPFFRGLDDAGAGQLYTPLTPGTRPGQTPYFVHSSNVENVNDPAYRMTHVNEFRVPAGSFRCRYEPQAAVLAASPRHSVTVWEGAGNVTYASQNRDGTPGVRLSGGQHGRTAQGQERYRWNRGGYRYVLELGNPNLTPHLSGYLSVFRGAKRLSREELLAYTVSTP